MEITGEGRREEGRKVGEQRKMYSAIKTIKNTKRKKRKHEGYKPVRKGVWHTQLLQCGHWVSLFSRGSTYYLLPFRADSSLGRVSSSMDF